MPRFLLIILLLKVLPLMAAPIGPEPMEEPRGSSTIGALSSIPCVDGHAGNFPCNAVDLLAYVPLEDMGCGNRGNDIWGWTDPVTGTEYALMGCNNGTSFIDLSDPEAPVYIGRLPTHANNSSWRDIKVHADHAYIVSESVGHGLQVFDLTQLRDVSGPPVVFESTAHLGSFSRAHNIAINEDSGFAYVVGSNLCGGGLNMVDINEPASPVFAGCFSQDGYTHDTQCVIYSGPDTRYQGSEICFNSNLDTLTIVDVTDKSFPVLLERQTYDDAASAHQGWLTEDHQYFLLGDEADEVSENNNFHHARTIIWDVSDLEAPSVIGYYFSTEIAIDHNLYIHGNHVYQANYTSGLRILDLSQIATGELTEVAYFGVIPEHDASTQNDAGTRHDDDSLDSRGAWSNFPFFDSGIVIVSSMGSAGEPGGLFVLQPHITKEQDEFAVEPGLTAHWFDPERSGEGLVLEILNENSALVYWFTYDDDGNQRWLLDVGEIVGDEIVFSELTVTRGGQFGLDFDPDEVEYEVAGEAVLKFSDCNSAEFSYTAFGQSATRQMVRLTQTMAAGCQPAHGVPGQPVREYAGQTGSWYDLAHAGEGYTLQWMSRDEAVLIWFSYDPEGNQYWMLGTGTYADGRIEFPMLHSTRGAKFGEAFESDDVKFLEWGSLSLELECLVGTAEYQSELPEFGSGDFDLTRLSQVARPDCPYQEPSFTD